MELEKGQIFGVLVSNSVDSAVTIRSAAPITTGPPGSLQSAATQTAAVLVLAFLAKGLRGAARLRARIERQTKPQPAQAAPEGKGGRWARCGSPENPRRWRHR